MKGTLLVFKAGEAKPVTMPVDGPPTLDLLKDAIGGGYVEVVPGWDRIVHAGDRHQCVAFCDEDGKRKQLPMNMMATMLWDKCMRQACGIGCGPDYLSGQIAVVYGDEEFMEAL
jgi:hypothetical protein